MDLQDMQATVDIATKEPDKFGIAPEELKRRREYVTQTRRAPTQSARPMTLGLELHLHCTYTLHSGLRCRA